MSQRTLHEHVRRAFAALTAPPSPQLADRVRQSLWERPAPAAGRPAEPAATAAAGAGAAGLLARARPPASLLALIAGVLLVALVAGLLLFSGAGRQLGRQVARLPGLSAPSRGAAPGRSPTPTLARTSTPSASPSVSPSASPSPTEQPTPAPTATPAAPAPPPVAALPGYSCDAQSGGGGAQGAMTTARVGAQNGFDRFVIQFGGGVPRFEVQPQGSAAFVQNGGATTVTLQGSSGLKVVLRNASGAGTYGGPSDMQPGFSALREARLLSDSQGVVEWGIGLSHATCFHAWTLGSPSRLVIDVQQ